MMFTLLLTLSIATLALLCTGFVVVIFRRQGNGDQIDKLNSQFEERARVTDDLFRKMLQDNHEKLIDRINNNNLQFQKTLIEFKDTLQESLNQRLKEISGQVEKRLSEGFEKTTATFTDIVKRLALIDEAQKKITELSTNVVSLQEILSDKRSRGAFGEVQLSSLIHNMLPENVFSFQHTFENGKRADCVLFLPKPTGNIAIDAKFPLESFQVMTNTHSSDEKRQQAEQQFRLDIKKHIQDIAEKYIIPGHTADGAMMFIPAEAVFAEIHAHYPDLVEMAQKMRVWMVSPTTLMAVLTTVRAVLKDEATSKQVHIIQDQLSRLAKDFGRFQERMNSLTLRVKQAHEDAEQVNISARKITSHFQKIENVQLDSADLTISHTTELLETLEENE